LKKKSTVLTKTGIVGEEERGISLYYLHRNTTHGKGEGNFRIRPRGNSSELSEGKTGGHMGNGRI